jgi:hypothetical protein
VHSHVIYTKDSHTFVCVTRARVVGFERGSPPRRHCVRNRLQRFHGQVVGHLHSDLHPDSQGAHRPGMKVWSFPAWDLIPTFCGGFLFHHTQTRYKSVLLSCVGFHPHILWDFFLIAPPGMHFPLPWGVCLTSVLFLLWPCVLGPMRHLPVGNDEFGQSLPVNGSCGSGLNGSCGSSAWWCEWFM